MEISAIKIWPDGTEEIKSTRVNPEMPISPGAMSVHGIANEDVAGEPVFRQYAKSLSDFLQDCDIGGFGVARFDLPMLEAEFRRVGLDFSREGRRVLDALVIFHQMEPRDLVAAYQKYCGKELMDVHTSGGDARSSIEVLDAQIAFYDEVPQSAAELHNFCNPQVSDWVDSEGTFRWGEDVIVMNFGKHSGKPLSEVVALDSEYLQWVAGADFPSETKGIVINAMNGTYPESPDAIRPSE